MITFQYTADQDLQSYNPDRARELLAEAGYLNGEGFPKLTLWLRNESACSGLASRPSATRSDDRPDYAEFRLVGDGLRDALDPRIRS